MNDVEPIEDPGKNLPPEDLAKFQDHKEQFTNGIARYTTMNQWKRSFAGLALVVTLFSSAGWASDQNRCGAGLNVEQNAWYLACDQVGCSAHCALIKKDSTSKMSALTLTYLEAAKYICSQGGRSWLSTEPNQTNCKALGLPVTAAPVASPPTKPSSHPGVETVPSSDILTSKIWQFGRSDGTVLVAKMRLLPGGRIEGAAHSNESKWAVVGNELLFYDSSGKVSTRYNSFRQDGGHWVISGPFLLWGNITHVLREVG
jgi:hypothetical protein